MTEDKTSFSLFYSISIRNFPNKLLQIQEIIVLLPMQTAYFGYGAHKHIYPMEKKEKPIIGHIGVIGLRRITSRKKRRVLNMEEREKLVAQAKSAYEIRINPA